MCMSRKAPKIVEPARAAAPANKDQAELEINPTDAETDAEVRGKKRRGKGGLTVSRKGVQYAGSGSGLNIPTK